MTVDRSTFLKSHQAAAQEKVKFYQLRMRAIGWIRLVLIVLLLVLSYWAMQENGPDDLLWSWALGLPLFLYLVKRYEESLEQLQYHLALAEICHEEQLAQKGEFSRGVHQAEVPVEHTYARELDLFGPRSLHHHINRAWTKDGADFLVSEMLDPPYDLWAERQAFFKELEERPDWALDYRAQGETSKEHIGMKSLFEQWQNQSFQAFPNWYWPFLIAGLIGVWVTGFYFSQGPSAESFRYFLYALIFNWLLLGSRIKVLRAQHAQVGKVSEVLGSFAKLLRRLEGRDFRSNYGQTFKRTHELEKGVGQKLNSLSSLLSSLDQTANAVALMVLNGLFHYHLFRLKSLENWHAENAKDLVFWIEGLHKMEAYLSWANYHANHPEFNWPKVDKAFGFKAEGMGHPLIRSEVKVYNQLSLEEEKYIILTGSNMSGKSTFLRCIGVNLILAQLGAKVDARAFEVYPYQLLCSMNPQDDLRAETSYFQAEIIRLSGLLNSLTNKRKSFFLLDEILRGTNSDDKQEGTRAFLQKIKEAPAQGLIATHDVDIAHMADTNRLFRAAYFESQVVGEELQFDYKLRAGICKTPNASLLMKRYGLI